MTDALALAREGRVYELGRVLDSAVPAFPGRFYRQEQKPGHAEGLDFVAEQITAWTHTGTHLDSLVHLRDGARAFDGPVAGLDDGTGVQRLGVETIPQLVLPAWLVDVAPLGPGDVITPEMIDAEPEPGDAVLFHTGWGAHWDEPGTYLSGEPGPGLAAAEWLAARGVALTGCDTWSYGPVPPEGRPFEVPLRLNVDHGVYIAENLALAELAADGVRRFCLVLTFPRFRGATAAWSTPIALV